MNARTFLVALSMLLGTGAIAETPIVKVTTISYGQISVETSPITTLQYTSGVLSFTKPGDGIFKNGFE